MDREEGFGIWFTGLPASGKTTLAHALADELAARGLPVQVLDSDALRQVLTPEPSYTEEERAWFYGTMVTIGRLLAQNGINVLLAGTAHRRAYRDRARQAFGRFAEIYVRCSLETCMERDEKGVYAKALAHQASTVPGLQVPYETPQSPEVTVDTELQTVSECTRHIVSRLEELSFLQT